ncbi:hypothetical protein [Acidianus manzaensis]|uniref:Uncharacterized protein n=1 Tax=Acidianus manzaensis TaxID=282676 RepID=A0A1W6JXY2_9CREN|nr:hypothetical protein [Acidianus manzaensis]ARM75070.1 hypothetical protein B6F84_02845 [Acidianus manzaensis]
MLYPKIYPLLLILSSISLVLGGILLIGHVPYILTISTFVVVVILISLSFLILKGYKIAIHIGGLLGILAILSSSLSEAHLQALLQFGSSAYISILDILMILGFYLFPIIYLYFWISQFIRKNS